MAALILHFLGAQHRERHGFHHQAQWFSDLGCVGIPGGFLKHRLLGPMQEFLNQWGLRFVFLVGYRVIRMLLVWRPLSEALTPLTRIRGGRLGESPSTVSA